MSDPTPNPPSAANPSVTRIASLAQLKALCEMQHFCTFELDDKPVEIPIIRLSPEATDKIDSLETELFPPIIRGKTPRDEGYPFDHEEYRRYATKREALTKTIRALTIYQGCPAIRQAKPDLQTREEITAFIQGGAGANLTDLILEKIFLDIRKGGMGLVERANFTSAAGSVPPAMN
jgi:hypothetical protein